MTEPTKSHPLAHPEAHRPHVIDVIITPYVPGPGPRPVSGLLCTHCSPRRLTITTACCTVETLGRSAGPDLMARCVLMNSPRTTTTLLAVIMLSPAQPAYQSQYGLRSLGIQFRWGRLIRLSIAIDAWAVLHVQFQLNCAGDMPIEGQL